MLAQLVNGIDPVLALQGAPETGRFFDSMGSTENWLPGAVAALGVALITIALLRRWLKRSRASRARDPKQALAQQREQLQHRTERDSLEKLMVEVQELTRVCAAQIENRASKLEHLIQLADQRLNELERATERPPVVASVRSGGERDTELEARPSAARTGSSRDWSSEGDEEVAAQTSPARRRDQLAERVHELSEMGLKSVEIARQLDEQVGKVELILALREAS
ncbi:MAG: hypothetical protein ACF8MJ_13085 [Phycisphaerales bacterium JB050]